MKPRPPGFDLPPAQREEFEERAGIMEYDGELERLEAERRALEIVQSSDPLTARRNRERAERAK